MLVDPSMEELLPNVTCAYELAVLVSKRANQLVNGGQPMVADEAANMVSLACREVAQKKVVRVEGVLKKDEFSVPLTKEAREAIAAEKRAREAQEAYKREAMQADIAATAEASEAPAEEETVIDAVESFEVVEEE
ncbi:MAG: DNA-directed RNA polymerase subunit omega [Saccharofermentans sp.]|nr:DNA-directed RNA polymerase subunit omega [Saccharofermentans sp.]